MLNELKSDGNIGAIKFHKQSALTHIHLISTRLAVLCSVSSHLIAVIIHSGHKGNISIETRRKRTVYSRIPKAECMSDTMYTDAFYLKRLGIC